MRLTKSKTEIDNIFAELKAIEDKNIKNHLLQLQEVIAIIWSYRKNKKGCYLSRETLASMCWTSASTIQRCTNWLRDNRLVEWDRWTENGKKVVGYKPSKLLESYLVKCPAGTLHSVQRALDNPPKGGNWNNSSDGGVMSPHRSEWAEGVEWVNPDEIPIF